jgi:hypothetical protein
MPLRSPTRYGVLPQDTKGDRHHVVTVVSILGAAICAFGALAWLASGDLRVGLVFMAVLTVMGLVGVLVYRFRKVIEKILSIVVKALAIIGLPAMAVVGEVALLDTHPLRAETALAVACVCLTSWIAVRVLPFRTSDRKAQCLLGPFF